MRIRKLIALLLFTTSSLVPCPSHAQGGSPVLILTNANVLDGVSPQPIRQATVTVREGKIVGVTTGPPNIPANATVLDLKGKWLLPGLIDAHVHFSDLTAARIALASGVTTVRTGSAPRFLDIGIRELNHEGIVALPDVVACGYQVVKKPPELFFIDFPKMADLMPGVTGEANVRRVVRALIDRGVNVIKILATERSGVAQGDPRKRTFTDGELRAAVDEARKSGIPVMAHAHGDEGAAAAVLAGVRSIEHGTFMSDRTLGLMKERGTYLVPTLTVGLRGLENPEGPPEVTARSRANRPRHLELTARAVKMGVKIVTGSDVRYDDQFRVQDELVELVRVGLSPIDAIRAATSRAAECLMIDTRTGSIKAGLEADLIVVERDPTVDIETLRDVLLVVNNGKIAVNRLDPE
jgi:imidazolonepropionase-like amidohydrolase